MTLTPQSIYCSGFRSPVTTAFDYDDWPVDGCGVAQVAARWPVQTSKDGQADGDLDAVFELNVSLGEEGDGLVLRLFPAILCDMKLKMACKRGRPREPGQR